MPSLVNNRGKIEKINPVSSADNRAGVIRLYFMYDDKIWRKSMKNSLKLYLCSGSAKNHFSMMQNLFFKPVKLEIAERIVLNFNV